MRQWILKDYMFYLSEVGHCQLTFYHFVACVEQSSKYNGRNTGS